MGVHRLAIYVSARANNGLRVLFRSRARGARWTAAERGGNQRDKKLSLLTAQILLFAIVAVSVNARVAPPEPRLERVNEMFRHPHRGVPYSDAEQPRTAQAARPARLGGAAGVLAASRGALIAQTWRDYGTNANMNRQVAVTEPGSSWGAGVQFTYIAKKSAALTDYNRWGWNAYDAKSGSFITPGGSVIVQDNSPGSPEQGSYPRIMTNPATGGGIVGSYNFPDAQNNAGYQQEHVAWEALPFSGDFGTITDGSVMPDSINHKGNIGTGAATNWSIWPGMAMTCTPTDTIIYLHAFQGASGAATIGATKVFRRAGGFAATPPYPDVAWQLVFTDSAVWPCTDICTSPVSTKVAACWVKWTPSAGVGTQSCDVHYATSATGLSGSWTSHNLTNYTGNTFRAYNEVNCMYDSQDFLHIIWPAGSTEDGGATVDRACRIFHWSDHNPSNIYTVYNANFDPTKLKCVEDYATLNVAQVNIGECDGKLYTVFTDWNDPNLADSVDDCAKGADPNYGANGEIWVTVSSTLQGKSWDRPRDLSNNFTPGCDTSGGTGGNCADDRFSSISLHGIDDALYPFAKNWASSGATYDPSGSYSGTAYTEVFYLTDRFPGGAEFSGQGPYTLNDLRWIRLACVQPIPAALLAVTPNSIDYPEFTHPGVEKDSTIIVENTGNVTLNFSPGIAAVEDSCKGVGCVSGWLSISSVPTVIPEATQSSLTLHMNVGGISNNATGPTRLWGHLQMNYSAPATNYNWPLSIIVADSIANTVWDTIVTSTNIKLAVGSNGNMGENYAGHVNMNFNPPVECDNDTSALGTPYYSRGTAAIYMGDGSPVIIRKPSTPDKLIASWSIFNQGYTNIHGFKPLPPQAPWNGKSPAFKDTTIYQRYFSGTFTTTDSVLKVEKTWYAPKTSPDTNNFIVEKMQIWPTVAGSKVDSLYIGEAYDWDIPTDSGLSNNYGNFDATRRLVYLQGFLSADTITSKGYDCTNNAMRYGGSALIVQGLTNDCSSAMTDSLFGGYTAANDSFVHPTNGFVPLQLYTNMKAPGYSKETRVTDQHVVLTFKATNANPPAPVTGWTLPAQVHDTLTVYSIMGVVRQAVTAPKGLDSLKLVIDKGKAWANYWVRNCRCCVDTIPPAAVKDLQAGAPTMTSITLTWTATGNDSSSGTASLYEMKYSTSPTFPADWKTANSVSGLPLPLPSGTPQSMTVTGLTQHTTYYFGLRARDYAGNWSQISNVASAITSAKLVGYWKFDEGSGNFANDNSGYNNRGQLINAPTWTTGYVGSTISFNGLNNFVEVLDANSLDLAGPFTISAWVYPKAFPTTNMSIVNKPVNYALQTDATGFGRVRVAFEDASYLSHSIESPDSTLKLNKWQYIAGSWDGSSLHLYLNGKEVASGNIGGVTPLPSSSPLRIGAQDASSEFFNGYIDEVKVWAAGLYDTEIKREFQDLCCPGKTGDINLSGVVDLGDLSALVSYLTGGGYVLACPNAANVNGLGIVDLADLTALVNYLTGGGFVLPNCH